MTKKLNSKPEPEPKREPIAPANPYVESEMDYTGVSTARTWPVTLTFIEGAQVVVLEPGGKRPMDRGFPGVQPPFNQLEIPVADLKELLDQLDWE